MREMTRRQTTLGIVLGAAIGSVSALVASPYIASSVESGAQALTQPSNARAAQIERDEKAGLQTTLTLNVINVFTPKSVKEAGGLARAKEMSEDSVARTNYVLLNSGVRIKIHLIETIQDGSPDVDNLTTDGQLSDLTSKGSEDFRLSHAEKSKYTADAVMLFVYHHNDKIAGLSQENDRHIAELGFGTVNTDNIERDEASSLVYAHEFGHLLGLRHDVAVDNAKGNAHGFVNTTAHLRDVMSYAQACDTPQVVCGVMPMYSNPNIIVNGQPFGVKGVSDSTGYLNSQLPEIAAMNTRTKW